MNVLETYLKGLEECIDIYRKDAVNDIISPAIGSNPHCFCALNFYMSLKEIDTFVAKQIGDLYFTVHGRCYRNHFKTVDCLEYDNDYLPGSKRCTQYLVDVKSPSEPQWFDLPYFSGKPLKPSRFCNMYNSTDVCP